MEGNDIRTREKDFSDCDKTEYEVLGVLAVVEQEAYLIGRARKRFFMKKHRAEEKERMKLESEKKESRWGTSWISSFFSVM